VSGLASGIHVLNISATGTQDAASGGAWIWLNAFQVSGSVTPQPLAFSAGGVVSAASFVPAPNNQVSPGRIISLFGQNFTASASVTATSVPLPTQLVPENVSETTCGAALPFYNVSPGQINAQLCRESSLWMEVVIYATGLGATSPSFATGTAANQNNTTVMPVTVAVGGQNAPVVYSGLTESLVGLYQINITMPSGLTGSQPVLITAGANHVSCVGVTTSLQKPTR
jgi:hypothetical protein